MTRGVVAVLGFALLPTAVVGAQSVSPGSAAIDTARAGWSGLPTAADTGVMRSGWSDVSRYEPSMCTVAVSQIVFRLARNAQRDTLPFRVTSRDALPAQAVALARRCAAPVLARGTDAVRADTAHVLFQTLLELTLVTQPDDSVRRLAAIRVSQARTAPDRSAVLLGLINTYLAARPVRVTLAREALAQLDSSGSGSDRLVERFRGHYRFIRDYWVLLDDLAPLQQAVRDALTLPVGMTPKDRTIVGTDVWELYGILESLAIADEGADGSTVAAVRAERQARAPTAIASVFEAITKRLWSFAGKPFQAPEGYWFQRASVAADAPVTGADSVSASALVPSGHVTLVAVVDHNNLDQGPAYAVLRRLYAEYGAQGLDILLVDATAGYSRHTLTQEPLVEARGSRDYFFGFARVPIRLLCVQPRPMLFKPAPDGTRVAGLTEFERRYSVAGIMGNRVTPTIMVLDRQGIVRWLHWDLFPGLPSHEAELGVAIARVLRS